MSLGLLLDKYDVSTEEGLQKALSEIEKEELEVDSALSGALSKACNIEGRLRSASQAYSKLGDVQTDTLAASEMVEKTAALARDVSAKVRQLDLARSRVAECQRRVHDLIDLQLCSAGVEAAIKAHDYETGAAHVSRFLVMDPGSVAAARARGDADPRRHMARAADTLRDLLKAKFEEAARKEDTACVERLYKLFPQIGRAEEGVHLYAKYLANQLEVKIRVASLVQASNEDSAVYVDALTRVLEAGAAAATALLATQHVAPFSLLQQKICMGGRAVCQARSARRTVTEPRDPRALEPQLAELALMHARLRMYFNFLRRRTQAAVESLKEEEKKKATEEMEMIIAECELTRIAQDILEQYLSLERCFLEESVSKALKLSTPGVGTTSSSLVDDVFYIARKVIRRALSTGSVDGACCVLNEAASVLERDVAGALRRRLRSPPSEPLPFPGPKAIRTEQGLLAQRLNRDLEAQRELYLAHMNEAEAGAEWAERLAAEACSAAEPILSNDTERAKLESCAVGVGAATAAFKAAQALALAALRAALSHTVTQWAQRLADPDVNVEEMEEDADQLPRALETLLEAARAGCSAATADALLGALLADLAKQAEQRMLDNHYTRESGIAVERRARRLAAWCGAAVPAARERCARVTAAATLLASETQHVPPSPRLPPALVKDLLSRRTDFKIEDIKRLKI